jgi:hypothetical protein
MIVASFTVICDIFHATKHSEYIRLSESRIDHIAMDYVFSLFLGSAVLLVPLIIYGVVMEISRSNTGNLLLTGLVMGICVGAFVGFLVIPSLSQCSWLDYSEGFVHCLSITLILGLLIPFLVGDVRRSKEKANPKDRFERYEADPENRARG